VWRPRPNSNWSSLSQRLDHIGGACKHHNPIVTEVLNLGLQAWVGWLYKAHKKLFLHCKVQKFHFRVYLLGHTYFKQQLESTLLTIIVGDGNHCRILTRCKWSLWCVNTSRNSKCLSSFHEKVIYDINNKADGVAIVSTLIEGHLISNQVIIPRCCKWKRQTSEWH